MKKYFIAVLLALIVATPVYAYTVQKGDTPYGLWGINWRTELAKYGILDPRKLPVGLEVETEFMEVINEGFIGGTIAKRPTEFKTNLAEQKTEGHSNTTLKVTSITTKDGNTLDPDVLGSLIVLSVNPGASNAETVVCTSLSTTIKTFTGCTFGYRFDNPTATSSSNIESHSPGEPVIISNTDTYEAQKFVTVDGDTTISATNTVSGLWTYTHSKGLCFVNTSLCLRGSGTNLQWSTDGFTNSYNFTSTSITQLAASSTAGIGVTDSLIHILASTTQGMAFDSSGKLYVKTSSTLALAADSNGLYINTTTLSALFTSFSNAATTTPTANKIPLATSAGTVTTIWLATSTNGYMLQSTSTGARWVSRDNFISSSTYSVSTAFPSAQSTVSTTTIPSTARYAIVKGTGTSDSNGGFSSGNAIGYGGVRIDRSIGTFEVWGGVGATLATHYTVSITWGTTTIDIYHQMGVNPAVSGGASGSGVIYFYD